MSNNKPKKDIVSVFFIIAIFLCVATLVFSAVGFVYNSYKLSNDVTKTNLTIKSDLNEIINFIAEKESNTQELLNQIDLTNEKINSTITQLQKLQEIEYAAVSHNILTFLYTFLSSILIGVGTYYVNQCVKYTKAIKSSQKQISKNQKEVSKLRKIIDNQNEKTKELKEVLSKENNKTKEIKGIIETQQNNTIGLVKKINEQNIKTIDLSFCNYYQSIVSLIDCISNVLTDETDIPKKQRVLLCDYLPRLNSAIQACYDFSNSINESEMKELKGINGKRIIFDLNVITKRIEAFPTDSYSLITPISKGIILHKIMLIKNMYQYE